MSKTSVRRSIAFDPEPGCWSYPHGKKPSIIATFIAFLGVILNIGATRVCDFLSRDITLTGGSSSHSVGLWAYESPTNGECYTYPSTFDADDELYVAQTFSIVSSVLGGVAALSLASLACNVMSGNQRKLLVGILIFVVICEGQTFWIFNGDGCVGERRSCEMASGSVQAIISMFLYLVAAILTAKLPDGKSPE